MATNPGYTGGTESVSLTLTADQVALLDDLSAADGPCEDRSQALGEIIDDFRELAVREPVLAEDDGE